MKPVIQPEKTGCAIASAAAIARVTYRQARKIANRLGIYADDSNLWSDTQHIRSLLQELGIKTSSTEIPFKSWKSLPDCALLSIKWHLERGKPYWHWVIFVRENDHEYVLDSKKASKKNIRTDFGMMQPKWFIEVNPKT